MFQLMSKNSIYFSIIFISIYWYFHVEFLGIIIILYGNAFCL